MQPDFDGQSVDVFACGNTIGALLAFAGEREKTFRFLAEKLGNTLFLIRKENNPDDTIDDVRGYGHTFPEVYTDWDRSCTDSESHQRLVSYTFGGLKCVIRSEADGYLPRKLDDKHPCKRPDIAKTTGRDPTDIRFTKSATASEGLIIRRAGEVVPQSSIFDLKTRASRNVVDMEEINARVWANQTPNFIIAYHDRGVFNNVQVKNVTPSVEDWENDNYEVLGRLREALTTIDVLAEKQRVEVRRVAEGNLAIWTDTSNGAVLPSDLKAKWLGQ